jgi:hypothetical protein
MNTRVRSRMHFSLWNVLRFWVSVSITLGSLSPAVALAAPAASVAARPSEVELKLAAGPKSATDGRGGAAAGLDARCNGEREMLPGWVLFSASSDCSRKPALSAGSSLTRAILLLCYR